MNSFENSRPKQTSQFETQGKLAPPRQVFGVFCYAGQVPPMAGQPSHYYLPTIKSERHSLAVWRATASDLQNIAFTGNDFVKNRVDEEAQDQARHKTCDDHNGEGFLRVAADAGGHGGRQQAEASH